MMRAAGLRASPTLSTAADPNSGSRQPAEITPPAAGASATLLMRRHLDLAAPRSDAEALRMLRQAFPSVPLPERVTAMAERTR